MSGTAYLDALDLTAGTVLVCAVVALWRRDLRAVVSALAVQGAALGALAGVLAFHAHDVGLGVTAALVVVTKGGVLPHLLGRVVRRDPGSRESSPLVNVPASLVASAAFVALAYVAGRPLGALAPGITTRLAPIGLGTLLVGFFVLVSRRKAVSQIAGLLLVDNGIALVAFLLTAGMPLVVELGASLDLLLLVVVLQVLATTLHRRLGQLDLDQLRELHD